jgi:hypothetical protein
MTSSAHNALPEESVLHANLDYEQAIRAGTARTGLSREDLLAQAEQEQAETEAEMYRLFAEDEAFR